MGGENNPVRRLATAIATFFGLPAWAAAAIELAIHYYAGRYVTQRYIRKNQPGRGQIPLSERKQFINEPNAPVRVIYGTAFLAPTIVASFSDRKKLNMLLALCPHALNNSIEEMRINDNDFFLQGERANLITLNHSLILTATNRDGVSETRDQINETAREQGDLVACMFLAKDFSADNPGKYHIRAAEWDTLVNDDQLLPARFGYNGKGQTPAALDMKMSNWSWIHMSIPKSPQAQDPSSDKPRIWSTLPTLSLKVKRDKESLNLPEGFDRTPYSDDNAALACMDYLRSYTQYGEEVADTKRIVEDNLATIAQLCETRGYKANGVVSLDQSPSEVLEQFMLCMGAGALTESAGIRKIIPGAPSTVTQTLHDDQVLQSGWGYSPSADINRRVSEFICRYVDADGQEQSTGARYREAPFIASTEITLDLVNNNEQANKICNILMSREWNGAALEVIVIDPAVRISPYDKVRIKGVGALNLDEDFRVLKAIRTREGNLALTCIYEAPDLFDLGELPLDGNGNPYIPPARLPNFVRPDPNENIFLTINGTENKLLVRGAGDTEDKFLILNDD